MIRSVSVPLLSTAARAVRPAAAVSILRFASSFKPLYTAEAIATGGRDGKVNVPEINWTAKLEFPKSFGGVGNTANPPTFNPELLFASGYSSCFLGALNAIAKPTIQQAIPANSTVKAIVHIGKPSKDVPFKLAVELVVTLPGLSQANAEKVVHAAHHVCPYSDATRNNIEVKLTTIV